MEDENVTMFPRFRLECWRRDNHPQGQRFSIGLCAEGVRREKIGIIPFSRAIISGVALLNDDGTDFVIDAIADRPPEVTVDEARIVLMAIFEDMAFGDEYTDDLIWKPLDLYEFVKKCLARDQFPRVYRSIVRTLGKRALEENGMKIKEDLCPPQN